MFPQTNCTLLQSHRRDFTFTGVVKLLHVVSLQRSNMFCWVVFLAFDFCRFCVVIRFFHPRHNGQWPPTSKDFYTRSYPLHYFLILILEKEPVFPFSMLSAKQGNYWYNFITSLVWRGPWLGIDPWTSRTRSQHYTTRLWRRRLFDYEIQQRKSALTSFVLLTHWYWLTVFIFKLAIACNRKC